MNSIKTKSNNYTIVNGKAIGAVVFDPSQKGWMVYVAWEWPDQADKNFFAIVGAAIDQTGASMEDIIDHVADYGQEFTHFEEIRALFTELF